MDSCCSQLAADVLQIWQAGVAAVHPARLIPEAITIEGDRLLIGDELLDLAQTERIVVVGGGKAAGEMAVAVESALGEEVCKAKRLTGIVNVPERCSGNSRYVELHPARPWGVNEPTAEGVAGVEQMLRLVGALGPRDLCLCVLTGGASALMPAPIPGCSLADKVAITRELSARGANIAELNAVRRELSRVKGGGLARACGAGRLIALVLSDVPGDDLEVIGSGPCYLRERTPRTAVEVCRRFGLEVVDAGRRIVSLLEHPEIAVPHTPSSQISHHVIGNNAAAVDAAGIEAERLGYSHAMTAATTPEGAAGDVGRRHAEMIRRMRDGGGSEPDCLITGGEPTVELVPEGERGRGGRNLQLCLAALEALDDWRCAAFISGGTDGEDGPTDAAGAMVDEQTATRASELGLDMRDFLRRNDAYTFFQRTAALVKSGPTGTNVCDLRVAVVSPKLAGASTT